MQIIWSGQSFFQIVVNQGKDSPVVLAIDPYWETIGLQPPKFAADVVLFSHDHPDHNNLKLFGQADKKPFIISAPGEYEVKNIFIQGIPAFHDNALGKDRGPNTIYVIDAEELRLCHLGDLGQAELFPEQREDIGEVDVLMIPVGGVYTVDGGQAAKIVNQLEPKLVIPMHYALPKLKYKLEGPEKFLKALGQKAPESLTKLIVKKKDLDNEKTKAIILKP